MIKPVLVLVLWSLFMLAWLYSKRIPAMQNAKVNPDDYKLKGTGTDLLPGAARAPADNYNHLMEQPTIFYATALAMQISGSVDDMAMKLAWGYVGLRILHSLVQANQGKVMIRFSLFMLASIDLLVLAARFAMKEFG